MIELARAQDEEVGDGTTSVIILAGEIMSVVEGFLEKSIHPSLIVNAYFKALEEICKITESLGVSIIHCIYLITTNLNSLYIKYLYSNPLTWRMMKIYTKLLKAVSELNFQVNGET